MTNGISRTSVGRLTGTRIESSTRPNRSLRSAYADRSRFGKQPRCGQHLVGGDAVLTHVEVEAAESYSMFTCR